MLERSKKAAWLDDFNRAQLSGSSRRVGSLLPGTAVPGATCAFSLRPLSGDSSRRAIGGCPPKRKSSLSQRFVYHEAHRTWFRATQRLGLVLRIWYPRVKYPI